MTAEEKIVFLRQVYSTTYDYLLVYLDDDEIGEYTESMFYLMGAICNDSIIVYSDDNPFIKHIEKLFNKTHPVWNYITIEE